MSNATKIARKRVRLDLEVTDGQLIVYDDTAKEWVAIDPGDLPVSAAGVSATTLNAALAEIFAAISPP